MTHLAVLRAFDGRPPVGRHAVHRGRGGVRLAHPPRVPAGAPRRAGLRRHHHRRRGQPGRRRARPHDQPARAGGRRHRGVDAGAPRALRRVRRTGRRRPHRAVPRAWPVCTTSTATSPSPVSSTARRTRRTSTRPRSAATPGCCPGVALIGTGSIVERTWTKPAVSVLGIDAPRVAEASNVLIPRARAKVSLRLGPGDDATTAQKALAEHLVGERAVGRARHGHAGRGRRRAVLAVGRRRRVRRRPPHLRRGLRQRAWSRSASAGRSRSSPSSRATFPGAAVLVTGVGDPASRWHGIDESLRPGDVRPRRAGGGALPGRTRAIIVGARRYRRPVIEARGLARTFRTRRGAVVAVAGVDIDVAPGELVGFLGPNGAGKTTTLRMLTTLLRPTAGSATVAGHDLATDPAGVRRKIGYVGQSGGAGTDCLVGEELVVQARLYGISAAEARAARRRALGAARPHRHRAPGRRARCPAASGGGSTSRWGSSTCPQLLFLDEPSTGLDPQSRANLWDAHPRPARRARHHPVPHHPLPRRGRCAVRPHPRHRPGRASSPRARPMR